MANNIDNIKKVQEEPLTGAALLAKMKRDAAAPPGRSFQQVGTSATSQGRSFLLPSGTGSTQQPADQKTEIGTGIRASNIATPPRETPITATTEDPIKTITAPTTDDFGGLDDRAKEVQILMKQSKGQELTDEERQFKINKFLDSQEATTDSLGLSGVSDTLTQQQKDAELRLGKQEAGSKTDRDQAIEQKTRELEALNAQREDDLRAAGATEQEAAGTALSFSGFGRSTFAAERAADIQKNVERNVTANKRAADLELTLFKRQIEGEDEASLQGIRDEISGIRDQARQFELDSALKVAELNQQSSLNFEESFSNLLQTLSPESAKAVNKEASELLGYVSDEFGNPLLGEEGDKIPIAQSVKDTKFQSQFNPITGDQVIFDPVTGKNIARISPFGNNTNIDITNANPVGTTGVAQYSQIYMGSPANPDGVDLAGQPNSPINSNVSGTVTFAGDAGGWGNQVRVQDSDGNIHQFSHLNGFNVQEGDTISPNQLLGLMGNSGNVMAGDGSALTPEQLAEGRGTHLDYTVYKPEGGRYSVNDAAGFLGLNSTSGVVDLVEEFILDKAAGNYKQELILRRQIANNGGEIPATWQDERVSSLSAEILKEPSYKEAQEAVGGYDTATQGFLQQNGFGDIAMVNGYQRIIDPGAAVRGEDVKTQTEAVSYIETALNIKGKIFEGDRMLPEVREKMLKAIADQYNQKIANFNGSPATRFKTRSENLGIPFELVGEAFEPASIEDFTLKLELEPGEVLIERDGVKGAVGRNEVLPTDIIL